MRHPFSYKQINNKNIFKYFFSQENANPYT